MDYENYRTKLEKTKYFASWNSEQLKSMTAELKEELYQKYLVKCEVLQRDNFECQSAECFCNGTKLTIHHVRAKRNGGKDIPRNLVTLCISCHQSYEKGKRPLVLRDSANLPKHMRGQTYRLQKTTQKFDWKAVRFAMRQRRKSVKSQWVTLTMNDWHTFVLLMRFLEVPYSELDDDL